MAATVHAGGLERMMEQLCRLQLTPLGAAIRPRGDAYALRPDLSAPPRRGGVYTYWWVGDMKALAAATRSLTLHGPGGSDVEVEFDDEWMALGAGGPVPLYVGKTAKSLRKRMGQHLLLGTAGRVLTSKGRKKPKAPTTSCQVRSGVERLFPTHERPLDIIRESLGLSFVELHDEPHAANRFYLETLAIGRMRPILNLDVER